MRAPVPAGFRAKAETFDFFGVWLNRAAPGHPVITNEYQNVPRELDALKCRRCRLPIENEQYYGMKSQHFLLYFLLNECAYTRAYEHNTTIAPQPILIITVDDSVSKDQ